MDYVYMSDIRDSFDYPDYLAHHGIKGQRWGIRRFQTLSGALTEAGRKRYGVQLSNAKAYIKKSRDQYAQYSKYKKQYNNFKSAIVDTQSPMSKVKSGLQKAQFNTAIAAGKTLRSINQAKSKYDRNRLDAKLALQEARNAFRDREGPDSITGKLSRKLRDTARETAQDKILDVGLKGERAMDRGLDIAAGLESRYKTKAIDKGLDFASKLEEKYKTKTVDSILDAATKGESAYLKFKDLSRDAQTEVGVRAIDTGQAFMSKVSSAKAEINSRKQYSDYKKQYNELKSVIVDTQSPMSKLNDAISGTAERVAFEAKATGYKVADEAKTAAVTAAISGSVFTSSFGNTSMSSLNSSSVNGASTQRAANETSFSKAQARVNTQKYNYAFEKARLDKPDNWQSNFKY